VGNRTSIQSAVTDVNQCGPDLVQDQQTFDQAAASRESLLSQLQTLNVRSLPPLMIEDLTNAWQASIGADQDFARWAGDEVAQGCRPDDTTDQNFQAATGPDTQATTFKTAFIALWNPIGTANDLPTYQSGQL
jgi:hypothetical protein